MSLIHNQFQHFLIAQQADGRPVELIRSADEIAFLAFDTKIKRLVELHVLKRGQAMDAVGRRSALDRIEQAQSLRGLSFMRVLEHGEENGVVYYSANLNDGESVEDYVSRRGAVPAVTVFCLMHHFVEDLVAAKRCDRLLSLMRVGTPLVTTHEDAFLQLRIVDYGLSGNEAINDDTRTRRVVAECGQLLFVLLTGQPYEGQNPDKYPALTCLPTNLRMLLRTALVDPDNVSPVLEKLMDDIREAYASLVPSIQVRTSKKHLILNEALHPKSHVQSLLLSGVDVAELLKSRYEIASGEDFVRYPFAIPAVHLADRAPVTVHLLPPSRIADKSQYETVPLQMWRFNRESHPNILRSLSLWETPDWTFLTEEREGGFPLSRLLAERGVLNPTEVSVVLRQVCAALDQAQECGVTRVDIHPSNLVFKVGREGTPTGREYDRLMQKRLDAWPPFLLKVRTHSTMRALYEPLLVEPSVSGEDQESFRAQKDFRNRSFVALAVYLLTGERQVGSVPEFGEAVPDTLAAFLKEMLLAGRYEGTTPVPADFLSQFESHMVAPSSEGRGFAAIRAMGDTPVEELESAGSVSDFDEDWAKVEPAAPSYLKARTAPLGLGVKPMPKEKPMDRGSLGMILWGIGASALAVIAFLTFFGGGSPNQGVSTTTSVPSPVVNPNQTKDGSGGSPAVRTKTPEEIKKAIVPTQVELQRLKQTQDTVQSAVGPSSGIGGAPVATARQ
ncbi:MAG: hypothetical protein JNJ83_01275 [Verrucomicrobiaceae bacterium]|nr:hypothetical protein [Verrucomicrobiaceae bacterium]